MTDEDVMRDLIENQRREIERLRTIETAARALCDECKPDLSPSLGAVAKLADALNTAWHARPRPADGSETVSDLIERLRERARGGYAHDELDEEAAAEIERLKADNEWLRTTIAAIAAQDWSGARRALDRQTGARR